MQSFGAEPDEGRSNAKKVIMIAIPVLALVTGLIVAKYVFHVEFFHHETQDPAFGKFAYSTANGQYVGKIEGTKPSTNEWIIKQPTGARIGLSKFRIEVSDVPPGQPDDAGKSYKSSSGKPIDH
jgi:hypothetical protein